MNISKSFIGLFLFCVTAFAAQSGNDQDLKNQGTIVFENKTKFPIQLNYNGEVIYQQLQPNAKTQPIKAEYLRYAKAKYFSDHGFQLNRELDLKDVKYKGVNKKALVNLVPGTLVGIKVGSTQYYSL